MTRQTHKILLLGIQAVALGAIRTGLAARICFGDSATTEITEYIQDNALARKEYLLPLVC